METTEKFLGGKDRTRRKREEARRQGAVGVEKGQGEEHRAGSREGNQGTREKTKWREGTIPLEMPQK